MHNRAYSVTVPASNSTPMPLEHPRGAHVSAGRWSVLASSLALMALVGAVWPVTHTPSQGHRAATGSSHGRPDGADLSSPPAPPRGTTSPSPAVGDLASNASEPVAPMAAEVAATPESPSSEGGAGATASAPAPATTPTVAQLAPNEASQPKGWTDVGNLTFPDNVTGIYPFAAQGAVEVAATWSGVPNLSLTLSCTGRATFRSGPSGLSVSEAPVDGNALGCTVSISELEGTQGTVSYSIAVEVTGTT